MRQPRFDVYQDKAGFWRWRLYAANGRTIADSGEGYTRKQDADRAVQTTLETIFNLWPRVSKRAAKVRQAFRKADGTPKHVYLS